MPLATRAFCVAAHNSNSMQVFLVAGSAPDDCLNRLRDHADLIADATFQVGPGLSDSVIQALNLQEDEVRRWVP
jgi:hypothetical protein